MKDINIANFFASALSEKYLPAVIVVDAEFNLRHVTDPAKKYLTVPNDPSVPKLTRMIPAKLAVALQVALIKVRNEALSHSLKGIKAKIGMQLMTFDITIEPFLVPKEVHNDQLYSIILHEGTTEEWETDGYENETFNSLNEINLTLKKEVDDLSRISREKESEQQREIAFLKQKLEEAEKNNQTFQSIHEDLQKLNSDYRFTISELTKSKSYLEHQIESLEIPFLFLDDEINIHKFSSGIFKLVNIRQADIGRPIKHYTSTFKDFSIHTLVEDVLASGSSIEDYVLTQNEEKYLVKGLPFHTTDNEHQGVVVIFYLIPEVVIEKLVPPIPDLPAAVEVAENEEAEEQLPVVGSQEEDAAETISAKEEITEIEPEVIEIEEEALPEVEGVETPSFQIESEAVEADKQEVATQPLGLMADVEAVLPSVEENIIEESVLPDQMVEFPLSLPQDEEFAEVEAEDPLDAPTDTPPVADPLLTVEEEKGNNPEEVVMEKGEEIEAEEIPTLEEITQTSSIVEQIEETSEKEAITEVEEVEETPLKVYTPEEPEIEEEPISGITLKDLLAEPGPVAPEFSEVLESEESEVPETTETEEPALPEFENSFLAIANEEQKEEKTEVAAQEEVPEEANEFPIPEEASLEEEAPTLTELSISVPTVEAPLPVENSVSEEPQTPQEVETPPAEPEPQLESPVTFFDKLGNTSKTEAPIRTEGEPTEEAPSVPEIMEGETYSYNGIHIPAVEVNMAPALPEEEVSLPEAELPSEPVNTLPEIEKKEVAEIEKVEIFQPEEAALAETETVSPEAVTPPVEATVEEKVDFTEEVIQQLVQDKPIIDEQLTAVEPTDFVEEKMPPVISPASEIIPESLPLKKEAPSDSPEFIELDDFDFDMDEEEEEEITPTTSQVEEEPEEPVFPDFDAVEVDLPEEILPPVQEVQAPPTPLAEVQEEPFVQEVQEPDLPIVAEEPQQPVMAAPIPSPTPVQPVVQEVPEKKPDAFPMYQKYFPASYDGFIVFDFQSQKVIYTDARIPEILKYAEEEMVGLHIMELSPLFQEEGILSSERMKQYFKKTLIVGQVAFEWKLQRKDQRSVWMRVSGIALPGEEVNHLLFAFKDISEEKAKIFSNDDTDWKLNMMAEKNYDGVIFLDSVSLRPASITQKATRLFNCTREEFYKHSPKRFMPHYQQDGRPSEEVFNQYLDVIKKKESVEFDWWLRKFDGAVFRARTVLYNLVQGNNKYIVMAIRELNPGSPNLSAESGSGQGYR